MGGGPPPSRDRPASPPDLLAAPGRDISPHAARDLGPAAAGAADPRGAFCSHPLDITGTGGGGYRTLYSCFEG